MNTRSELFILTAFFLLTGCSTWGSRSNLTKQEMTDIERVKNVCNFVNANRGELTLKALPVIDGKPLPEVTAQLGKNSKADFVIFETLWHQDVCVVQALAKDMPFSKLTEWDKEISSAFVGVPANPTGSYEEKIQKIHDARDKHLEKLKSKNTSRNEYVKFDLFKEAIPQDDFLKVTTLHSEIVFPDNYIIRGRNVAKSVLSGDLAPGEFSEQIRPALQVIRSNLGAYALGNATEKEILEATVASIYDAAANKIRSEPDEKIEKPTSAPVIKTGAAAAAAAAASTEKKPDQSDTPVGTADTAATRNTSGT